MELRKLFDVFWRRKWVIVTTALVMMVVVGIGSQFITPVYGASTTLRIATSAGGPLINYTDYMATDRLMNTYIELATSRPVTDELMRRLGLAKRPTLSAEIIPNTELIKITVQDTDPKRAATAANTLADILVAQNNQIYIGGGEKLTDILAGQLAQAQTELQQTQQEYDRLLAETPTAQGAIDAAKQLLMLKQTYYSTLLTQYEDARSREAIQANMITVWEEAIVPIFPSQPRIRLYLALASVVGLVGGIGLALVLENLDTTLYTTDDIEKVTKLTASAKIPKVGRKQIRIWSGDTSPLEEAFRNLATMIQKTDGKKGRSILVASAQPDQGKSTVTFHLALALAEHRKTVIVIDCDTRLSKLHSLFHVSNQCGLKDVLEQVVTWEEAVQKTSYDRVSVIASGSPLVHPSLLLGSWQTADLIKQLRQRFDYVLLDSPPMLAVADAAALAPNADSFILVVRRAHAERGLVQAASDFLEDSKTRPVYLVVNQVEHNGGYGYYKYRRKSGLLTLVQNRHVASRPAEETVPPLEDVAKQTEASV
ncbi:MAG: polysaccharide biosynthesis tyrosine autokinase [Candidatus Marsarchaeota archaeon]|nr:polysaccharide biosynthesis tyrosine autokinase [Candidatus Marsarchaeota archaeon]